MKNFVQAGNTIPVTAPSGGVLSGAPVRSGSFFGVASGDAAAGSAVEIALTGVFDLPKKSGDVVTLGALLYWDGTKVTITSSTNVLIGAATAAAGSSDATVRVRLNGVAV